MANFKEKVKTTYDKAKKKATSYGQSMKKQYDKGYKNGWDNYKNESIPFGGVIASSVGYAVGYNDKRKHIKLQNKEKSFSKKLSRQGA